MCTKNNTCPHQHLITIYICSYLACPRVGSGSLGSTTAVPTSEAPRNDIMPEIQPIFWENMQESWYLSETACKHTWFHDIFVDPPKNIVHRSFSWQNGCIFAPNGSISLHLRGLFDLGGICLSWMGRILTTQRKQERYPQFCEKKLEYLNSNMVKPLHFHYSNLLIWGLSMIFRQVLGVYMVHLICRY